VVGKMPKVIEAIYEDGVFKPLKKLNIKEGSRVIITIEKKREKLRKYLGILGKMEVEEMERKLEEMLE